jgi:hypothetical protein
MDKGCFCQNSFQTAPIESKENCVKLGLHLVLLTIRSCSKLVWQYIYQILDTQFLLFTRSQPSKEKKKFFPMPKGDNIVLEQQEKEKKESHIPK